MKQNLPDPSIEQVEYYLAQWDSLEDYHLQEDALDKLFFELCPEHGYFRCAFKGIYPMTFIALTSLKYTRWQSALLPLI